MLVIWFTMYMMYAHVNPYYPFKCLKHSSDMDIILPILKNKNKRKRNIHVIWSKCKIGTQSSSAWSYSRNIL